MTAAITLVYKISLGEILKRFLWCTEVVQDRGGQYGVHPGIQTARRKRLRENFTKQKMFTDPQNGGVGRVKLDLGGHPRSLKAGSNFSHTSRWRVTTVAS